MYALDRLIQLTRLEGSLDLRCLLGGDWALDHARAPDGEAVYHVVLSGECVLRVRGQDDVLLVAGDIAMLPRGDAHLLASSADVHDPDVSPPMNTHFNGAVTVRTNIDGGVPSLDLLCGRFNYAPNALLIDVLPDVVTMSSAHDDVADLAHIVGMMRKEANDAGPGARSIVSALSTALFTLLLRAHLALQPATGDVLALLANPRVGSSVIAMLEQPAQKWTIDMLAARSAMSRATYMRVFGALTTDSPMSLLTRIRMQLAGTLLMRTPKSIGEIADEVGYQSESAFSRNFREAYGVGPGKYRQGREA
jgi:AraC family transcriptional activator of mtrCDE